jgi:hypothetical protein
VDAGEFEALRADSGLNAEAHLDELTIAVSARLVRLGWGLAAGAGFVHLILRVLRVMARV